MLALAMALVSSPHSAADPAEPPPVVADAAAVEAPALTTLSLASLGWADALAFYGGRGTATLTFPVQPGMTPTALNGTLLVPLNVRSVLITVQQGDRLISRTEIPPAVIGPVSVPLEGVTVTGDTATVTVTTSYVPVDGYCLDPMDAVRLTDGAIAFAGAEAAPTAVADFFPPVLRKLTIALPPQPSMAESDAAVRLTASVAARYGRQNPDVVVVPLDPAAPTLPDPPAPLERQVIIRESGNSGLSLQPGPGTPALLVSGKAEALANQTKLIGTGTFHLALSPNVSSGPVQVATKPLRDPATLRDLGQGGITAVALAPQVSVGLDQTRIGHPVRNVRVHLIGSYTPLARAFAGQFVASVGGESIDHWAADGSGTLDHWVDIPDRLLQRYTNLVVALNVTGDTERCREYLPVTLTVDDSSEVQTDSANPPVPAGLQSLPQALMPNVQVGIGSDALADTARAVAVVLGLQRTSSSPMDTTVVSRSQAIGSGKSAIIIAADGWTDSRVKLPVSTANGKLEIQAEDADKKPITLSLDPSIEFGSLQTVFDGNRSLLIATSNGAPELLDGLLSALNADPPRWFQLDGAAIVAVPGRPPVTVPNPELPDQKVATSRFGWVWWVGAGAVALAALAALVILLNSRRSSRPVAVSAADDATRNPDD